MLIAFALFLTCFTCATAAADSAPHAAARHDAIFGDSPLSAPIAICPERNSHLESMDLRSQFFRDVVSVPLPLSIDRASAFLSIARRWPPGPSLQIRLCVWLM